MHPDADVEPEKIPKWAQNILQDAGALVGDLVDTRRNRSDFEKPPLTLTTTKPFPPRYVFLVQSTDPQSYRKATRNPFCESSMKEEYNSLLEKQTWDMVPLPLGRKIVRCRWVYSTKSTTNGNISRYKARLVAKGF